MRPFRCAGTGTILIFSGAHTQKIMPRRSPRLQDAVDHLRHLAGVGDVGQTLDLVAVRIVDNEVDLVVNACPSRAR